MLRFLLLSCLYLSGGILQAPPSPKTRTLQTAALVKTAGWDQHTIHTRLFTLKAYGMPVAKTKILTVYIEGDGLAWLTEERPSDNPTPIVPTGLKMALNQKNAGAVYLARPCQFVFNQEWAGCQQRYWTQARFSSDVILAMSQAIDYLKKYYHAKKLILIGYSGGGTIAALLTAQRADVAQLITVAAVLDTHYWVQQANLTPLYGSLNPADAWKNLVSVPQIHWVGGKDTVVPKEVAFAFAERFPIAHRPKIKVVPAFDHTCCWIHLKLL
jgi:predicted esterase